MGLCVTVSDFCMFVIGKRPLRNSVLPFLHIDILINRKNVIRGIQKHINAICVYKVRHIPIDENFIHGKEFMHKKSSYFLYFVNSNSYIHLFDIYLLH